MAATYDDAMKQLAALQAQVGELKQPVRKARDVIPERPAEVVRQVGGDSRGFSLCRVLKATRTGNWKDAAAERDVLDKFKKAMQAADHLPANCDDETVLMPFGTEFLPRDLQASEPVRLFKSMWAAGVAGADPDEADWLAGRVLRKDLSYLQFTAGATLVAPAVQGELIELVRPKECLMAAGATSVPLPPNGRIAYPVQTGPSTMYWTGENTSITASDITTAQLFLQAKKGSVFQILPNELIKYAAPAADALVRNDSAKTIALGVDFAGLYGTGGATQPKGLVNYTGTNEVIDYAAVTPAPKGVATNGNTLRPEDSYRMVGLVEDRNFEFGGWIMRPTMANNMLGYRADAVSANDAAGGFVQGLMRAVSDRLPSDNWGGYRVTKSAIVRNNQVKAASGATLTEVFGGQWEHLLVGMYGAVEMAASNQAGNSFQQDQTYVRTQVFCDIAPRYPSAFAYYKQILNTPQA